MKLATANVLTLATGSKWHGTSYTKQQLLQKQFHDEGCVVVGLQETRHRRIVDSNNEHYHMVGHAASSDGLDGVQMWFSKLWPLYESGPVIQRQHITIVSSAPAYLIVRLCMPHFRAIFVKGRAPHNGLAHELSESFWRTISQDVCPYERDHLLFFMGDTNGHLGEHVTDAVGSHDGSQENGPGREFHNWMLTHHLCAPSTMIDYHVGARSSTFSSPDGVHKTRIDYIAVPTLIQYDHLSTWVDENIDLCGVREDHAAVVGRIQFTKEISSQRERSYPPPRLDRQQLAQHLGQPQTLHHLADVLTDAPWSLDPHRSADWLAAQTNQALFKLIPRAMRWRRKRHIPDEIWTQVENKKAAFRQLRCMKQTWRRTMMQTIFQTWRKRQPLPDPQQHLMRSWSALFDKAFAQTLLNHQQLTRQVTTLIKNADVQFYQAIAHESGQAYTHEGLTALWKRIKAVLPKNRIKQFQARYEIGDDLQQHFADLEAGQSVDDQVAQQQCVARNNRDCEAHLMPQHIALQELPTLAEIEELCLKQRPHRAAGLDGLPPEVCRQAAVVIAPFIHNVLLKAFVSGVEPFRYKGGLLVPIWKHKQSRQLASAYRGILLADVFVKVLHAWTRKRLLSTLLQRKAPGQIGGLPSQQTVTAVQLLRLHGKIGRSRRLSTAAIFVDLKAAFHHMLREFIFSVREPTTREMLDRIFDPNEFDVQQLARDLHEACNQQPHDIPAALRGFLHDIHKDTWFKLDASAQMTTVTQRGTRPGSPLADIGFNLLMSKMMWQIGDKLNTMPAYTQGCQAMGVTIPPLSWVDDLAVPIAVAEPSQLLPLMREVVAMLHETFQAHGMTMNFESGKSEAVVMYRGCGAAPLRTALFDTEAQPKLVVSTPTHILSLCIVATYRHLGARFTMDTDIAYETKLRAAMARLLGDHSSWTRPFLWRVAFSYTTVLSLPDSCTVALLGMMCPAQPRNRWTASSPITRDEWLALASGPTRIWLMQNFGTTLKWHPFGLRGHVTASSTFSMWHNMAPLTTKKFFSLNMPWAKDGYGKSLRIWFGWANWWTSPLLLMPLHLIGRRFGRNFRHAAAGKPWSVELSGNTSCKKGLHAMWLTITSWLCRSSLTVDSRYGRVPPMRITLHRPLLAGNVIAASIRSRPLQPISIANMMSCQRKGLTSNPHTALAVSKISTPLGECNNILSTDRMDAGIAFLRHAFLVNPLPSACRTTCGTSSVCRQCGDYMALYVLPAVSASASPWGIELLSCVLLGHPIMLGGILKVIQHWYRLHVKLLPLVFTGGVRRKVLMRFPSTTCSLMRSLPFQCLSFWAGGYSCTGLRQGFTMSFRLTLTLTSFRLRRQPTWACWTTSQLGRIDWLWSVWFNFGRICHRMTRTILLRYHLSHHGHIHVSMPFIPSLRRWRQRNCSATPGVFGVLLRLPDWLPKDPFTCCTCTQEGDVPLISMSRSKRWLPSSRLCTFG